MKKSIFCFMVAMTGQVLLGELIAPPKVLFEMPTNDHTRARATLQYINHINHILAKLESFDDVLILQQEYENLTDNNLNLQVIQDEAIVQIITQLMDFISKMSQSEVNDLYAKARLEQKKRDAIFKAMPNPGSIIVATKNPKFLALTVGIATLNSVQNYFNARAEAKKEYNESLFNSANKKLEYLNEINKELFYSQWRLIHQYKLSDAKRITRNENALFLGFAHILEKNVKGKSDAKTTVADKIVWEIFRNNEKDMSELPFYWVTRATAAANLITPNSTAAHEYEEDLKKSCEAYFGLYKDAPIIRKDLTACTMGLLYITTHINSNGKLNNESDEKKIREWLTFIENTSRIPEWQIKFSVARIYKNALGDNVEALRIIKKTFLEVHACLSIWEQSEHTRNIFYVSSSIEKAYRKWLSVQKLVDRKKKKLEDDEEEKLKNWKEMSQRYGSDLLPIDGWFWLNEAWSELIQEGNVDQKSELRQYYLPGEINYVETEIINGVTKSWHSKDPPLVLQIKVKSVEGEKNQFEISGDKNIWYWMVENERGNKKVYNSPITEGSVKVKLSSDRQSKLIKVYAKTKFDFQLLYEFNGESNFELQRLTFFSPWRGGEKEGIVLFEKGK